jgi:hypothetical protein
MRALYSAGLPRPIVPRGLAEVDARSDVSEERSVRVARVGLALAFEFGVQFARTGRRELFA